MTDLDSDIIMKIFVPGRARTKGSMKPILDKAGRYLGMKEDHDESKPWRIRVIRACREYISMDPYTGAVLVELDFLFRREPTVSGGIYASHQTPFPTAMGIGDTDKLARNILDAIGRQGKKTSPGVIDDDRWVSTLVCRKRWTIGEPGVWITIRPDKDTSHDG